MSYRDTQNPGIDLTGSLTLAEVEFIQDLKTAWGTDPNADRILFWDDSAGSFAYLTLGTNLTITGTTLDASASSGASTALDNLASVAINTSLISDTNNTDDLGSAAVKWANLFVTTIGATGTRVTKGWFTDIESTNMPTVGGTSLSSTFAPIASPTFTGTVTVPAANFTVGASIPFSDSAGTLTLQNIDALDATTEATIEAAIDTLANLTSIQGRTITLADAGANALFGWDDTAGAYENLTQAEARTILGLGTAAYVATDLADLNEATIEAAIDTLANLTSIQGQTVTFSAKFTVPADPGADRFLFWDESANDTAWLTPGNGFTITTTTVAIDSASDTVDGIVELATAAETTTGTDATRAVTPDGLAGSTIFGRKAISVQVTDGTTDVATGDGKAYFTIPEALNGMNLVRAQATVVTAGTTNATTVMIHNKTDAADMLSGAISIASAGTVGTVGTVNGASDDVATNDVIRIDVDSVSTTAPKGLMVVLEFQLP